MPEDRASQSPGVLYDFVYLDRQRLAALAAQLFEQGLLTSTTLSRSRNSSDKTDLHMDAAVVKGGHEGTVAVREGIERIFDASWSVPLDVIDQLRFNDMISDDVASATYGQLILLEGKLNVYDVEMLKTMYRPFIELAARSARAPLDAQYAALNADIENSIANATGAIRQQLKKNKAKLSAIKAQFEQDQEQQMKQAEAVLDLIKLLPHALQATVEGEIASAWMTLSPDQMITNPDDFALKHGSSIPGVWSVIGTLDTRPTQPAAKAPPPDLEELLRTESDNPNEPEDANVNGSDAAESSAEAPETTPQTMVEGMRQMQDAVRAQFGRPDGSYGITPIAIYRQVRPFAESSAVH